MRRTVLVALTLAVALAAVPAPVEARHAYDCEISHDPTINETYCAPHCAWDALSGGWWKFILQCLL